MKTWEEELREQAEVEARLAARAARAKDAMCRIAAVLGTRYTVHHGVEQGWAMVTLTENDLAALAAYVEAAYAAGVAT